jgi:hypothetical protein
VVATVVNAAVGSDAGGVAVCGESGADEGGGGTGAAPESLTIRVSRLESEVADLRERLLAFERDLGGA